jgi:glycosyltransferase involved in cell wall biosynthesis
MRVLRAAPGCFEDALDALGARRRKGVAKSGAVVTQAISSAPTGLNWKGRLIRALRRGRDQFWFPDARSAWVADALRVGGRLIGPMKPDVVLGSHEPGASLIVARSLAAQAGIPWVAELGDPVLTSYTPRHWARRSLQLERVVCREAAAVVVTSNATRSLLIDRHGEDIAPVTVIPQGFELDPNEPVSWIARGQGMRLVYTGRFYAFRDPTPLLDAVQATPGCQLLIAAPELPEQVASRVVTHSERFVYLGALPHSEALALQREADVLVNIGNTGMSQIPGKLLEYLGAARPIMHIEAPGGDASTEIVLKERCGFVSKGDSASIGALLEQLSAAKQQGKLEEGLRLGQRYFGYYSWDALSARLEEVCVTAAGGRHSAHSAAP